MTTYLKREHTADELQAKIECLEATLAENPAREFIKLVPRSGKSKGTLDYITVSAYRTITGNIPNMGMSKDGIHIPYHLALDTIADALGYSERAHYGSNGQGTDLLKQDIESALKLKHQIDEYKIMLKGVSPMPEKATDTTETPQKRTTEPWSATKMDAAAKEFEVELKALLNNGNQATDLCKLVAFHYMRAGHKRIGRILVKEGKQKGASK